MAFVGVSTGSSSIMRVFPRWADYLGLPTRELVGHDLPVGVGPDDVRALVADLRADPAYLGALVTTHKVAVYAAAADLFDRLDPLAVTFGEVSAIYRRDGAFCGAARDPVTVRRALEDFLPADHFTRTGGAVLCLGSGGAGSALSHVLGERADRPARVTVTSDTDERLDHQRELHRRAGLDPELFRYVLVATPSDSDALLDDLPPGSLAVNATGLGKDRPGSPVTDAATFPTAGYAWEFNYRGDLGFLRQARAQQDDRSLVVEDGWRYFVHGWSTVVADVFDLELDAAQVEELARIAAETR